jgi:hypothetical protein
MWPNRASGPLNQITCVTGYSVVSGWQFPLWLLALFRVFDDESMVFA